MKMLADEDLTQRKVNMMLRAPTSVDHKFDKPNAYTQAILSHLKDPPPMKEITMAVNKRLQHLRYIRTAMRATLYVQTYPTEPKEGDEKRARSVFERKKWNEEVTDDNAKRGKIEKPKRGDFKKVLDQINILRSGSAVRCSGGQLPTTSGISYRHPSRFATDQELQAELYVMWKSQAWPGVCDTAHSAFQRGENLYCFFTLLLLKICVIFAFLYYMIYDHIVFFTLHLFHITGSH
jgi:hypothetical protein